MKKTITALSILILISACNIIDNREIDLQELPQQPTTIQTDVNNQIESNKNETTSKENNDSVEEFQKDQNINVDSRGGNTVFAGNTNIIITQLEDNNNLDKTPLTLEDVDIWNLGVGYKSLNGDLNAQSTPIDREQSSFTAYDLNVPQRTELYCYILSNEDELNDMVKTHNYKNSEGIIESYNIYNDASNFNAMDFSDTVYMIIDYRHFYREMEVESYELKQECIDTYNENGEEFFIKKYGDCFLSKVTTGVSYETIWSIKSPDWIDYDKEKMISALKVIYSTIYLGIDLETALFNEGITEVEYISYMQIEDTPFMGDELFIDKPESFLIFNGYQSIRGADSPYLPLYGISNHTEFLELKNHIISTLTESGDASRILEYKRFDILSAVDNSFYSNLKVLYDYQDIMNEAYSLAYDNWSNGVPNTEYHIYIIDLNSADFIQMTRIIDDYKYRRIEFEDIDLTFTQKFFDYIDSY